MWRVAGTFVLPQGTRRDRSWNTADMADEESGMVTYGAGRKIGVVLGLALLLGQAPQGVLAADAPSGPQPLPEVWTPRQAVAYALTSAPDVRLAGHRIQAAQALVAQAESALYPQLRLGGGYSQTDNPMYSFGNILNQGAFHNGIDFNDPGRTDSLQASATVSYRLLSGGADSARIAGAQAQAEAMALELATVHNQLGFETVRAVCTIVQAEEMTAARQAAVEALDAALSVALARHDQGDLLAADLLDLEARRSQAGENLIQARHGLELARKSFLHLLGFTEGEARVVSSDECHDEQAANVDISARPELKAAEALVRAAEAGVRVARAGRYPTVDGFAGYQYEHGFENDGAGDSWNVGVRLNYSLFDGQRTSATIREAESRLAEVRERQRKLMLALNLELTQARLARQQAEERVVVTGKMVAQATESARLQRERFTQGLLLSAGLIDVENRLTEARVRQAQANAALRTAMADLRRAQGKPQFEEGQQSSGDSKQSSNVERQ